METKRTTTIKRETNLNTYADVVNDSKHTQKRLDQILAINAKYARKDELYKDEQEELAAQMMENPFSTERAFELFGLMLGTIPPATIFSIILYDSGNFRSEDIGLVFLTLFANIGCAIAGYFAGNLIGKIVTKLETLSWHWMLLATPFVGVLWGLISGAAGGLFIFVIGAIFGAIIGGMVGGVAIPAFSILHRWLKKGDKIDRKHFYPIAFGITVAISAAILGA